MVVSIQDMSSSFYPTPGLLLVYVCQEKGYSLVHQSGPQAGRGGPRVWLVQDLNRDEAAELITSQASCGENACSERFQFLVWNREVLENRLRGSPADFIDPQVAATDLDGDGTFDVKLTGRAAGSGGTSQATPTRVIFKFDRDSGVWQITP
jgi:hypothetical protein